MFTRPGAASPREFSLRTANPAFNTDVFSNFRDNLGAQTREDAKVMTVQGAVNKTAALIIMTIASAAFTWSLVMQGYGVMPMLLGGSIVGLILAFVTIFKKEWSPVTAPMYAIAEGFALGGLSAFINMIYPGIALQAVGLTFGVMVMMIGLYTFRIIKVTPALTTGIIAATGAICLVYMMSWILGMFGVVIPYIHGSGWIGIGFSLFVVGVAAFNLLLDFHLMEEGAENRFPKFMEWYSAFGVMVTLVWLYVEILRLLMKLNSRD